MINKTFCTIKEACNETGLSQYYLRRGCKSGSVPHIVVGTKFMINLPLLQRQMDDESMKGGAGA